MNKITFFKVDNKLSVENNTMLHYVTGNVRNIKTTLTKGQTPPFNFTANTTETTIKPNGQSQVVSRNLYDILDEYGNWENISANIDELKNLDELGIETTDFFEINKIKRNTISQTILIENITGDYVVIYASTFNDTWLLLGNNATINLTFLGKHEYLDNLAFKKDYDANLYKGWLKNLNHLTNSITVILEGRNPMLEYNYLRAVQDDFVYYFFITNYVERGANQVQYHLEIDSLNTYKNYIDYNTSKGLILREHRDRFNDNTASPIYDEVIESIDVTPTVLTEKQNIASNPTRLALKTYGGTVDNGSPLSMPNHYWQVFSQVAETVTPVYTINNLINIPLGWGVNIDGVVDFYDYNDEWLFTLSGNTGTIRYVRSGDNYYMERKTLGTRFDLNPYILSINSSRVSIVGTTGQKYIKIDYLTGEGKPSLSVKTKPATGANSLTLLYDLGMELSGAINADFQRVLGDTQTRSAPKFNNYLLTDTKISKIIELPYMPANFTVGFSNGMYIEIFKDNSFKQKTVSVPSKSYTFAATPTTLKIPNNDPKLEISQFNPYFITWFNESMLVRKESQTSPNINLNPRVDYSDYSKVRINLSGHKERKPFENSRTIDMNNTIATVRSDLANYLEFKHENDLKLMQLQETQATRNLQKQAVNIGTRVIGGAVGGALAGGGIGAVGGAIAGGVSGVINLGFAIDDANRSKEMRQIEYENKIIGLQNSLINVAGSNPILERSNEAYIIRLFELDLRANEKEYLDLYFHKYGYETLRLGSINFETREKFNYYKVIFEELKSRINLNARVREDILKRFSEGVTVFYYNNNLSGLVKIDFEQKYENREVNLI